MIPLKKILETSLYVDDLEAARSFYGEKLGLQEYSSAPGRYVFFRLAEGMLLVFNPDSTVVQQNRIGGSLIPQHGATGAGHMAFTIAEDQVDRCLEELEGSSSKLNRL